MKKLMITAAASALMFGAAACSNETEMNEAAYDTDTAEMAQTEETDVQYAEADTEAPDYETVYLVSGNLSAGEIVGAKVIGADGEDIATVDDLLIGENGQVETVIFRSGDFIDLAGMKGSLPYSDLDMTMVEDGDPAFTISMTEEDIQNVAEFDQEGLNDYRLVSEMIGTTADFTNSDDSARINDVIVSEDGEALYAIVGDPILGEDRQIGFDMIMVEQDADNNDTIMINASSEDLEMMPVFRYEQEDMDMSTDRESSTDWDDASDEDDYDTMNDNG
ncbi:MAG TPA: PRC-barrel domain containing protein [Henriciella marina]|uniref:PRC-barrel domain-containing protein n=1 Tax=Henriciella sp. TaxID=1968823 RepID=UPI001822BB0D|nr:PRC-barrel domain-containing protein [Henriciella sp.]HIG23766.1 PRC-barrel domain containing protein [Henriciella sp.]HIK66246.1 PRC-barrel domain containing protein [Henriciella marina]